jgi:lipid-binding SYLF domain-containing protein
MKKIFLSAALAIGCTLTASAQDAKLTHRIEAAHAVLHQLMDTPDKGIPLDIAAKAHCIVVIPSFKKAAFGVGAEYGQGVATCRHGARWSAPVFVQLTGASFGFQIGGESSDIVLIGLNSRSLDDLLKDKIKLGGDIAVAAGPVGRDSQAATTELANAEFLTYSRSKGLFAGIDLNGDEVHQNSKDTEALYGANISFHQILNGGVPVPPAAAHFVRTCNELFREGRAQ